MSAFRYKASYDNPAYMSDGLGNKKGAPRRIQTANEEPRCCRCKGSTYCIICSSLLAFLLYAGVAGGLCLYYFYFLPNAKPQGEVIGETANISGSLKIVGGPYGKFSIDLTDSNSELYRVYSDGFTTVMDVHMGNNKNDILGKYKTTSVYKFTPGSVVVNFTMMFTEAVEIRTDTSAWLVKYIKSRLNDRNYLGDTLQIDPASIKLEIFGSGTVPTPTEPEPTLEPGKCHKIPDGLAMNCSKYWEYTYSPNILGNDRTSQIISELATLSTMLPLYCDPNLELYFCSLYVPKCENNATEPVTLKPCRNICQDIIANCKFGLEMVNNDEVFQLTCDQFPEYRGDDGCVGGRESASSTVSKTCNDGEVECDSGRCISKAWRCDGYQDCDDKSDETGCSECPTGQIHCGNSGRCINQTIVCNGVDDCYGGSDERNCYKIEDDKLYIQSGMTPRTVVCQENWNNNTTDHVCKEMGYTIEGSRFKTVKSGENPSIKLNTYNADQYLLTQISQNNNECPNQDVISITCGSVQCGLRPVYVQSMTRIVGGTEVSPGHWPFAVALLGGAKKAFFCSGALINEQWVLTAAHCIYGLKSFSEITLRLGAQRRTAYSIHMQDKEPVFWLRHPKYVRNVFPDDIALIKLNSSVEINDYVRPICLPNKDMAITPGEKVTAAGWGKVAEGDESYSTVMNQVLLGVVPLEECIDKMSKEAPEVRDWFTKDLICVGGHEGVDTCNGDSGSPLMLQDGAGRWVAGGITASGIGCGRKIPAVYTRVTSFLDWIYDTIQNN